MDSEWSFMLMDTLQMKPLDGIEMPKAKFGRARPVGLPKPLPHLPRLHDIHTTEHHHENSETPEKSSPQEQLSEGISPILSSTVLADMSKLNSSMANIPMSPIPIQYSLSMSPPSPSIADTASPTDSPTSHLPVSAVISSPSQHSSPHLPVVQKSPTLMTESSPYPVALLANLHANTVLDGDDLNSTRDYSECGPDPVEIPAPQILGRDMDRPKDPEHNQCQDCGKTYKLKSSLARHRKTHTQPVTCEVCGMTFSHTGALKRHKDNKHLGVVFPCEICPKKFRDSHSLKMHVRGHDDDFRMICETCGKGFNNVQSFQAHVNKHTNRRPYVCNQCDQDFLYSSSYYRHVKSCQVKPSIPCPKCGKLFKSERYLKDHVIKYNDPQKHTCHICGLVFSHRSTLYKHVKRVHAE